jgi:DNA polymerase III alpha subunit (gram-positive type)
MNLFGITITRTKTIDTVIREKTNDAYARGYDSGASMQRSISELQELRAKKTKKKKTAPKKTTRKRK